MAGNTFGTLFRITTWGESHGPAIGVVIDGCPAGLPLDLAAIQRELDRRRPGQTKLTTARTEADKVEVMSGLFEGRTSGTPICLIVRNRDADSAAYDRLRDLYRPGHADFTYVAKYGLRDHRGGGRSSARETAARVAAGAVAKQVLAAHGITIWAHTVQVGDVVAQQAEFNAVEENPVRTGDPAAAVHMAALIERVRDAGDSIGCAIAVTVDGVPPGLGEPVFDRTNAELAKAFFSLPGVKGVEFGAGFGAVQLRGSQMNDQLVPGANGGVAFASNNAGGTLGGITTGQQLLARIAFKPPSSIKVPQKTVTRDGQPVPFSTAGRHDPCICPRAVPAVEAMTALVLADLLLRHLAVRQGSPADPPTKTAKPARHSRQGKHKDAGANT